jgi:hypothetical protein
MIFQRLAVAVRAEQREVVLLGPVAMAKSANSFFFNFHSAAKSTLVLRVVTSVDIPTPRISRPNPSFISESDQILPVRGSCCCGRRQHSLASAKDKDREPGYMWERGGGGLHADVSLSQLVEVGDAFLASVRLEVGTVSPGLVSNAKSAGSTKDNNRGESSPESISSPWTDTKVVSPAANKRW